MTEDVVNRFEKFKLGEEEDGGVVIAATDVKHFKQECERSLLGKVWGVKQANFSGIKSTLTQLWKQSDEIRVVELGYNFFQFIFPTQAEKDRILQKRPWFFDGQLVVLQAWTSTLNKDDQSFTKSPFWIHIRGLPNHWSSREVGWKLGKLFPLCLNVILLESGSKEGRVLKLLVEVDLNKPLMRGTRIKLENEQVWVDFRYEQLPTFCFYCGKLGHSERSCSQKMQDSREGTLIEEQYGEWLRLMVPRGDRLGDNPEHWMRKKREQTDGTALAIPVGEGGKSEVGGGLRDVGSTAPDLVNADTYLQGGGAGSTDRNGDSQRLGGDEVSKEIGEM